MKLIPTQLRGAYILEPKVYEDARGYFMESFSARAFTEISSRPFVQDNESFSRRGVVRGLHYQRPPHAQAKLVRVVQGEILDVAVDLRQGSPSFGAYIAVRLSGENRRQLYIPRGFAHGFAVLSDTALLQYKCDNYYSPESEGAILWSDPTLSIDWGISPEEAILSEKDSRAPLFADLGALFSYEDFC